MADQGEARLLQSPARHLKASQVPQPIIQLEALRTFIKQQRLEYADRNVQINAITQNYVNPYLPSRTGCLRAISETSPANVPEDGSLKQSKQHCVFPGVR